MSTSKRYFDLAGDVHIPGRWYIKSPLDALGRRILPWRFQEGRALDLEGTPVLPVTRPGQPLDFTLTEVSIAVVSQRFVSLYERLGLHDEVQFIPAQVEGYSERYFILNALRIIKCIDEARCREVAFWEPRHGEPERVGQYRNVRGLKVDPARVGAADVFRPWGWTVVLIVSERVKVSMESEGISGTRFTEV